jgi:hypothetical protein
MYSVGVVHAEPNIQTLVRRRYCQAEKPRSETAAGRHCSRTWSISVRHLCKGAPTRGVVKSARESCDGSSGQDGLKWGLEPTPRFQTEFGYSFPRNWTAITKPSAGVLRRRLQAFRFRTCNWPGRFRSSPASLRMKHRSRHLRDASIYNIEKEARRFTPTGSSLPLILIVQSGLIHPACKCGRRR